MIKASEHFDRLLLQFARLGLNGAFGPEAQGACAEYAAFPSDMARALKYLVDFYADGDPASDARDYFVQILLVVYRDVNKINADVARAFANAFVVDFPGTVGTALLPRWNSLAEACYGFKGVAHSDNPSIIWQQASRLVLHSNEFLDGLIGLLLIAQRCAAGKKVNPGVLRSAYGSKVDQFEHLTNGESGAFYLFFRIARPVLRNALAHGDAWLDIDAGVIRFPDRDHIDRELDTAEFLILAKLGCDLTQAYIAFLSAVLVFDAREDMAVSLLPEHLVSLWDK